MDYSNSPICIIRISSVFSNYFFVGNFKYVLSICWLYVAFYQNTDKSVLSVSCITTAQMCLNIKINKLLLSFLNLFDKKKKKKPQMLITFVSSEPERSFRLW